MQGTLIRAQSSTAYNKGFTMLVVMLKVMFSYNQLMMLDGISLKSVYAFLQPLYKDHNWIDSWCIRVCTVHQCLQLY